MTPEAKEMMKILENLQKVQDTQPQVQESVTDTSNQPQRSVSAEAPANIREDAKEMYNILAKLEMATETATQKVINEQTTLPVGEKGDQSFGVGKFQIELTKKNLSGKYIKTYYSIVENGEVVYGDIALFESAMGIAKQMLFKNDSTAIKKILELDSQYDDYLSEAAMYKAKLKTLNESAKADIFQAKHSNVVSKMSYIKKQIKTML